MYTFILLYRVFKRGTGVEVKEATRGLNLQNNLCGTSVFHIFFFQISLCLEN